MLNQVGAVTDSRAAQLYTATLAIGSTNPVKIQAVKNALSDTSMHVIGCRASSNVREQPLSDEETRQGAIFRAKDCLSKTGAEFGMGLEGGILFLNDSVYLCHWGALVDRNENVYITNGPIILLPTAYREELLVGKSLEDIMHATTGIQNLGSKKGAIAIFTADRFNREQILTEIAKVLLAQHAHYQLRTDYK